MNESFPSASSFDPPSGPIPGPAPQDCERDRVFGGESPAPDLAQNVGAAGDEDAGGGCIQLDVSRLMLSEDLLREASAVVRRRQELDALLDRARAERGRVKAVIFERVERDYLARLEALEEEWRPVAEELLERLGFVWRERRQVEIELERLEEWIEELRFRAWIGEISQDELDETVGDIQARETQLRLELELADGSFESGGRLLGKTRDQLLLAIRLDDDATGAGGEDARRGGPASTNPVDVEIDADDAESRGAESPRVESPEEVESTEAGDPSGTVELRREEPAAPVPAAEPPSDHEDVTARALRIAWLTRKSPGPLDCFRLEDQPLRIGRSREMDVRVDDPSVSRRHAEVRWQAGAWIVEDVSSGGGLRVNGQRATFAVLHHGDLLRIGTTELEFSEPRGVASDRGPEEGNGAGRPSASPD